METISSVTVFVWWFYGCSRIQYWMMKAALGLRLHFPFNKNINESNQNAQQKQTTTQPLAWFADVALLLPLYVYLFIFISTAKRINALISTILICSGMAQHWTEKQKNRKHKYTFALLLSICVTTNKSAYHKISVSAFANALFFILFQKWNSKRFTSLIAFHKSWPQIATLSLSHSHFVCSQCFSICKSLQPLFQRSIATE